MKPKICRICLSKSALLSVFDKQDDNIQYSTKIMRCVNIVVVENDGLPDAICDNCVNELASAYQFINKCEASDKALRCNISELYIDISVTELPVKIDHLVKPLDNIKSEDIKPEFDSEEGHVEDNHNDFILNSPFDLKETKNVKRKYTKSQKFKDNIKRRKLRTKIGPVACEVCGHTASCRSALEDHVRTHTGEKPFVCEICDLRFNLKSSLKRHVQTHHTEARDRKFVCETCGNSFFTKSAVITHMRVHTNEKPYSCTCCGAAFRQVASFIRHKQLHTGEKPFTCPVCFKRFADKSHMVRHQSVHSDDKNFTCHLCNKHFKTRNSLRSHFNTHSNEKNMICSYCGMAFSLKGNLTSHIRRKHSERSGVCNICNKTFPDLESHLLKHTGEKPFVCKLCDQGFMMKRSLSWHIKFKHQNSSKFKCSVGECTKAFPTVTMLEFHLLKQHTNHTPYICHHCSRGFYRTCDLTKHLKVSHMDSTIKIPVRSVK